MGTITIPSTPFTLPTTVLPTGSGALVIGSTPISGGINGEVLFDNAGVLGVTAGGGGSGNLTVGTSTIAGGISGRFLYDNAGVLGEAIVAGGTDPLFLTQGFSLIADNPTVGSDANFRRGAQTIVTFDQLNSNIGFCDQVAQYVQLNFNTGINVYAGGTNAKSTPIALNVGGSFYGAGEKFTQSWNSSYWSMGDAFLWSALMVYAGGPIAGDEGQGLTPASFCLQPSNLALDTITAVQKTGYTTIVTSNITGSQNAQNLPVATTVGAVVGDWVILNQSVDTGTNNIWAMQILSISAGVSINGVCAINLTAGMTVTPALCMQLANGAFQFGEQRILVNLSGASYSTGLVSSVSGGAFNGSSTTWTNSMVGGNALNVGVVYLDVDTFTGGPTQFSFTPLKSYYQINQVFSTTDIGIHSYSSAGDLAYHGKGVPPAANMTYKILPGARVMRINPPVSVGTAWNVVCETSTHTWTVGDNLECAICPFPDLHGFDIRIGEYTTGGVCRYIASFTNNGARTFEEGMVIATGLGSPIGGAGGADHFAFLTGLSVSNAQTGILVFDSSSGASDGLPGAGILFQRGTTSAATDAGTAIIWQQGGSLGFFTPGDGMDWVGSANGVGRLRIIGQSLNIDTNQQQLVWNGYFQVGGQGSGLPYIRLGGGNAPGDSIASTIDLIWQGAGHNSLSFTINGSPAVTPLQLSLSGLAVLPSGVSTSNTTNATSLGLQLQASVWTGSAAQNQFVGFAAIPGSGVNHAPITLQFQIWDNVNNVGGFPNLPFEITTLGSIIFGNRNDGVGSNKRATFDPSALTTARTIALMDTGGDLLVAAANTTGAGSAALGANSPAVTNTAPYTWLRMISHDGSTVYVPAWK